MADGTLLANYQDFLRELMIGRQVVFASEHAFLAELSGIVRDDAGRISVDDVQGRFTKAMDTNRDVFHGKKITIPLQLDDVPGAAGIAEGGTFPAAAPFDTAQASLNLARTVQPIAISVDLERDARDGSTSAMESIAALTESAYSQLSRVENDFCHGNGDALLVAITGAGGSPGLTVPVGTSANFDQLTPGRVVSVLTRANGANPGNGRRRKIASVDRVGGNVVFLTGAVASDGDAGNITFSAAEGLYIDSSYGNAPQGLSQAVATSGTFEGVNKATVTQWQGIDATPAASTALTEAMLDNAVYRARGNGVSAHDFGIGHPKVIDLFKQAHFAMTRMQMQESTVTSGFNGVIYQGADRPFPLLKDLAAPRGIVRLILKRAITLYGDAVGPSFLDDDGSQWRFFTRSAVKEADLYDRWQFGVKDCGKLVTIGNATTLLAEAS